ncbi:helix-turn-helix domain-containing protein [Pseudobutyrivibrio xylanivorans]|uniref:AraC-type DNA-binding protein n=1 Tax=Pseudobutyrivibrio xylanivorans TaxID=185007 RepID=A0A1G5S206_PSEXY|nr:helix-turn-helix domain-containing protein [Pseudobutyrivibrio xylanivorans]SCZ80343.1 AraC-type DNA-binding protein [Pseudobutyrivibrio xylanivorans]
MSVAKGNGLNKYCGRVCSVFFQDSLGKEMEQSKNLRLFYVVSGKILIDLSQKQAYELEKDGIYVVNPEEQYRLSTKKGIVACIEFSQEEIYRLLNGKRRVVDCNSAKIRNGSLDNIIDQIRRLLGSIFRNELGTVAFEKNGYEILLTLFSEYSEELPNDDRAEQVKLWLENSYREPITLEEAAEHFNLTPQYFSRWFAETFDTSFLKYLSATRCENAREELIRTDNTILKIALDNGFPNAASFTRTFTNIYGQSPIQYRKDKQEEEESKFLSVDKVLEHIQYEDVNENKIQEVMVDCDGEHEWLSPYWLSICNVGRISTLASYDVQNQIRILQSNIKYNYARVILDQEEWDYSTGFYEEDKAIAFLYEIGITPIFIIDYRICEGNDNFIIWLHEFLKYNVHRFGMQDMMMEVVYDSLFNHKQAVKYNKFIKEIRKIADEVRLGCKLAGPGLLLTSDGSNLASLMSEDVELDFISIRCSPLEIYQDEEIKVRMMKDQDFVIHQYQLAMRIAKSRGMNQKIIITSWQNSISEKDSLNDSSWLAARIVRSAILGYGILPSLPVENPLDITQRNPRETNIFNGNSGLITMNELKKPAFYAYKFLAHLDEKFLYRDEHMIVTSSFKDYFQIVVQNGCPLSYQYYLNGELDMVDDRNIDQLFESRLPYRTTLVLKNVADCGWFIKIRRVNEVEGNVLKAWQSLNYQDMSFIGKDEMELLRYASCPTMRGLHVESKNGELRIPIDLEPNEIQHIHVIPER